MGSEIWYRGEAEGVTPSRPGGGSIHDLGEGVYFTSDREVAKTYADTRAKDHRAASRAYAATIDLGKMRVLDLTKDARWNAYLKSQPVPPLTVEQLIRQANENYGRFFEAFRNQHKINLNQYDAVIGPEFVRGGKQLCILLKNGKTTPLHAEIRAGFQLYYQGGREIKIPSRLTADAGFLPSSQQILTVKSPLRRAAGNQAAAAMMGVALGGLAQWLGNKGMERTIRQEIETTHAQTIETILSRGEGVLIIIRLKEWQKPNDIGMRAQAFLSLHVQGGKTQQDALTRWRATPKWLADPGKGWRTITQYVWAPPPAP
jgi:hypothetical protein